MHPILIQIGPLEIRWYGVMIATACLVGYWLAGREAERKGIGKEKFHWYTRPKASRVRCFRDSRFIPPNFMR